MKNPLGVSPSKGYQGTTRGKEKILIMTSVGIEPTTSGLDLPLLCRLRVHVNVVPRSTMNTNGGIYTSELILCSSICVVYAAQHLHVPLLSRFTTLIVPDFLCPTS